MKIIVEKYKEWLALALFAIVLTAGLLYIRFPSDAVTAFLQARAGAVKPPLSISIGQLRPSFLVGLKMEEARVTFKDQADQVLLKADRFLVRPGLWSLLQGKSTYNFSGSAYKGDISGSVELNRDKSPGGMETEVSLSGLRVDDFGYLSHLMGRPLKGTLDGTISYKGPSRNPLREGSGEARAKLVDGQMLLLEPFLTFDAIDFKEMDIELVLQQGRINVARVELKGDQMQGTLSGTILLKEAFADSSLNLKGTIEPFAAFFESARGMADTVAFFRQRLKQGTLSFVIRGTLREPEVKFT